jgi:hypothetical protein
MTKRRRRFIAALILACTLVTIGEWAIFSHYDALVSGREVQPSTAQPKPMETFKNIHVLNDNPKLVALSEHGQLLAYVDPQNTLRAVDTTNGKEVFSKALNHQATELDWIGDDSVFVGTQIDEGSSTTLVLNTINVSSGDVRTIHEFQGFSKSAKFQAITYSPYTNDVYVLISGDTNSVMYHFDTNGEMHQVALGGRYVTDAAVTQTTDTLFYQDKAEGTDNVLKDDKGTTQLLHRNSRILRVLNDTLFFSVLDSSGNVVRIDEEHDGVTSVFLTLANPVPPDKVFVDDDGHVIVVSGNTYTDERTNKTTSLPQYNNLSIRDNAMIFFGDDGKVTVVS